MDEFPTVPNRHQPRDHPLPPPADLHRHRPRRVRRGVRRRGRPGHLGRARAPRRRPRRASSTSTAGSSSPASSTPTPTRPGSPGSSTPSRAAPPRSRHRRAGRGAARPPEARGRRRVDRRLGVRRGAARRAAYPDPARPRPRHDDPAGPRPPLRRPLRRLQHPGARDRRHHEGHPRPARRALRPAPRRHARRRAHRGRRQPGGHAAHAVARLRGRRGGDGPGLAPPRRARDRRGHRHGVRPGRAHAARPLPRGGSPGLRSRASGSSTSSTPCGTARRAEPAIGTGQVALGGIKLFLDGSVSNRTAWLRAPYRDSTSTGIRTTSAEDVDAAAAYARDAPHPARRPRHGRPGAPGGRRRPRRPGAVAGRRAVGPRRARDPPRRTASSPA